MSRDQRVSRTSGHCRDAHFSSPHIEPERTVPASKLHRLIFGSILLITVVVGAVALVLEVSKDDKPKGAFPTLTFQLVQNYDRSITEHIARISAFEQRGVETEEDRKEYYGLLDQLQALKADRTRYAADYNRSARDILLLKKVTPADFKKAGFPLGIQ